MSIDLHLKNTSGKLLDQNLQFLPVKLEATVDEESNVDIYFDSYTSVEASDGSVRNTLRGHPVHGKTFEIPQTHIGVIFAEDKQHLAENTARSFNQTGQFERFVSWNYDLAPSANDRLKIAVDSFCLTEELHKRVDPVELELFLLSEKKKPEAPTRNSCSDSDTTEPK